MWVGFALFLAMVFTLGWTTETALRGAAALLEGLGLS